MNKMKNIIAVVLPMLLCILPSATSRAEVGKLTGSITAGGAAIGLDVKDGHTKSRSFKYGEYSGITQDGYGIGDFDLSYEGKDNFYLDFLGKDLGWDSRYLSLTTGWHGGYELSLEYDQIPHYVSNDAKTIFDGVGGNNLTLPAGFVRGDVANTTATTVANNYNTAAFTSSLATYGGDINIKTERKGGSIGVSIPFYDVFDLNMSYKREDKDGLKYVGGVFGTSGGDRRAIALPEPVNYTTDELNVSLGYLGEKVQANLYYYFSNFANKYRDLTFANPFQATAGNVQYYGDTGQLAMDPDNEHHRVGLSGAVDLPMASRLTLLGEYGQMDQNQALLPYTINPATVITTPMPRDKARGEIETYHFTAALHSKPLENLDADLKYRFYKTKNNTPIDLWEKADNDNTSIAGPTAGTRVGQNWEDSAKAAYNLPYDYQQNRVDLGLSYNIHHDAFIHTVLKTGYSFEDIRRSYRESSSTEENSFWAGLRSRFASYGQTNLNYTHAVRKNSGYDTTSAFTAYHSNSHVAEERAGANASLMWDNHPAMRKYDQADRVRDKFGGSLNITPHEMIALGAYYSYAYDDYTNSVLGLQAARNSSWTLDMNYTPTPEFVFFAYYTREEIFADQASWSFSGAASKAANSADATRRWWATHDDTVDTFGFGSEYRLMEDKLTLRSDVSYSDALSVIKFTTGGNSALNASGMPDASSNITQLSLNGCYQLTPNWGIGAGYRFEHYGSDDWATDGVNPMSTDLGDVITMFASTPDYDAHVGSIYFTYYFDAK